MGFEELGEVWKGLGLGWWRGFGKRFGGGLEEVWRKFGGGLEGVWKGLREEVWKGFGGGLQEVWRRLGGRRFAGDLEGGLEEVWKKVWRAWLEEIWRKLGGLGEGLEGGCGAGGLEGLEEVCRGLGIGGGLEEVVRRFGGGLKGARRGLGGGLGEVWRGLVQVVQASPGDAALGKSGFVFMGQLPSCEIIKNRRGFVSIHCLLLFFCRKIMPSP